MIWITAADVIQVHSRGIQGSGELADMFMAIADGSAKEEHLLTWIRNHLQVL